MAVSQHRARYSIDNVNEELNGSRKSVTGSLFRYRLIIIVGCSCINALKHCEDYNSSIITNRCISAFRQSTKKTSDSYPLSSTCCLLRLLCSPKVHKNSLVETQQSHVLCPHLHRHKGHEGIHKWTFGKGGNTQKVLT